MEIFGWIMLCALALFGLAILVVFAVPFVITEVKTMSYKIKKSLQDKKDDIDKRSMERKHRDEIKRQRDFELQNKKLDAKLQKVDKKIELQTKKLKLANELKTATKVEKENLKKEEPKKVVPEKTTQLNYAVPEDNEIVPQPIEDTIPVAEKETITSANDEE